MVNHVGETCDKCKQNCLLIHGKNITSPIESFFKIMIGENFSKIMHLPPKFGHTVSNLVGQNVNLEDSNGHQWVVTIKKVDNSIAFKHGWPAFSSDHGLNFGDFVIFHYLSETSFVVHVYDKSGCKKTDFPKKGYPNKRPRTDENYISKDAPKCHTSDKSSMNKQDSNTSAAKSDIEKNQNHYKTSNLHNDVDNNVVGTPTKNPSNCATSSGKSLPVLKPDSIDESYIMINRDLGCMQEEDRTTSMFDLSNFEMHCNTKTKDTTSVLKPGRNKLDGPDMVINRCQFAKPSVNISNEPLLGGNQVDATKMYQTQSGSDNLNILQEATKVCEIPQILAPNRLQNYHNEPRDNQVNASKMHRTSSSGSSPKVIPEGTKVSEIPHFLFSSKPPNDRKGKMTMDIKQEKIGVAQKFVDLTQEHHSREEMSQGISGKGLKFVKGSQSQSVSLTINETVNVVKNEHMNTEILRKDKMTMGYEQEKTSVTQEDVDLITERCEEMIQGISGKESSKLMKGSQSQSQSSIATINEPIDCDDFSPSQDSCLSLSCFVSTNNKSFLELPSSLPQFKGKKVANGNTVCLQDSLMRQFYVVYHERYNLKFLTSGWEAFCKAHSIQQGDECVFELENWEDAIFNVRINRRF